MTLRTSTHHHWSVAVAVGVLALSACSGGGGKGSAEPGASGSATSSSPAVSAAGELAVPADADEDTKKEYVYENAMASCMRAQGFTYTAHVSQEIDDPLDEGEGKDYAAAKKYRQKYGFGIWAGAVYRNDPTVFGSEAYNKKDTNPDSSYLNALSDAEKQAYYKAYGERKRTSNGTYVLDGCQKKSTEKAYGPQKSRSEIDKESAEEKQRALAAQQALNGDPQLVSLAQAYASCLTKEGIPVTTTQPTSIGDMVKFQVSAQTPPDGILSLSRSEALAKLTQEISVAGKDLKCGKDFRAAYFPKHAKHPFESLTG